MSVTLESSTSYTIVLSLTGHDRMFLHSPGANADFCSADVPDELLHGTRWMHFGYPPLMERMYSNDGEELRDLFRRARAAGATTSLDMSSPDPQSPSGQADWGLILSRTLPFVDFFLPSAEELLFMLDRPSFEAMAPEDRSRLPLERLEELIDRAVDLGASTVGLKLGSRGFLLRIGAEAAAVGRGSPKWTHWAGSEVWHPCFQVDVAGTTGSGDATIAGFILGCLMDMDPVHACELAVAVGACCCEAPDALSGVLSLGQTRKRIEARWQTGPLSEAPGWRSRDRALVKHAGAATGP
jgi:sugar/nucleoside kinase (ribokinase family)